HHATFRASHPPEEKAPDSEEQQQRNDPAEDLGQPPAHELARILDPMGVEFLDELRVVDARRRKSATVARITSKRTMNGLFSNGDLRNLIGADHLLEFAVGNLAARWCEKPCLRECHEEQESEHVPDGTASPTGK